MITRTFFLLLLVLTMAVNAQTTYTVNVNVSEKEILRGHLDLGGKNHEGVEVSVNSYYIEKGGKPFFPVVGELHYSRYPEAYWEESILKMKAGGINVIASYVFWNVHERTEGTFDWSGDLNLRKFVELVGKHGLYSIVRLGPFCHGEMRNGGIPDWMYGRPFEIRSNDPGYLAYVDNLYAEIGKQIKGLLFKDGGPVIGVQLENEYQHSHAPWEWTYPGANREFTVADRNAAMSHEQITVTDGRNPWAEYGKQHMAKLKDIAKKHGMDVPLYTATGWGNAAIVEKGSLPVTAGYAYPFWARPSPSPFYLFKDIHKVPDYSPVSFDTSLYPSIPAEIGPGIQVKHSRRPFVPYESVNPLMVRIVGSGSNGIGYYMYHGGSTPVFDGKFYNEEVNGIPRINYDFQAPIGQYGQTRYHYRHLRMLHLFLDSWGAMLAPMKSVLPETNAAIRAADTETLRYAVRSYGDTGFVFIVNFQDHVEIQDINHVKIQVERQGGTVNFPSQGYMNIPKATSAIFPFNLKMGEALLHSATVQPLTILHRNEGKYHIFSSVDGVETEMLFPASVRISQLSNARVSNAGGFRRVKPLSGEAFSFTANGERVLVLPQQMAMNTLKVGEQLYITDALVLEDRGSMQLISRTTGNTLHVFPAGKSKLHAGSANVRTAKPLFKGCASYVLSFDEFKPEFSVRKESNQKYSLQLKSDISQLNDLFLEVEYVGDRALAFIEGEMITDHFFHERTWEIGLRHFAPRLKNHEMLLFFHPIHSTYTYLGDLKRTIEFENGRYLNVEAFRLVPEYKTTIVMQ